jgi:ATP-binding cassette subfamily F protein 3
MQQMQPLSGKIQFGASLKIGYLAQSQEKFNPENSVLDELLDHKHMLLGEARSYLAQYLFRGEDVYKSVKMLSGGERARLALAVLALEGANFLLLDEPSNHLDIPAQEILQEVLEHFDGTILLVSHDRYLIDQLATQIWELRDGRLHITPHDYQEYLALREAERMQAASIAAEQRAVRNGDGRTDRTARNEERRRAQQIAALEDEIHRLEKQLADTEAALIKASRDEDLAAIQRLSAQYESTQAKLNAQMEAWTELAAA